MKGDLSPRVDPTRDAIGEPLSDIERQRCAVLGALMDSGQGAIGLLGLGSAGVAAGALAVGLPGAALAAMALLAAPLERVLALRNRLDAALFRRLAQPQATLAGLDEALHHLGLRTTVHPQRPLDDRIRGALRLTLQHAGVVLLQFMTSAIVLLHAAVRGVA